MIVAPTSINCEDLVRRKFLSLRFLPPSEKESGVIFRIAITWVCRFFLRACNEPVDACNGVMVDKGVGDGGNSFK